MRRPLFLLFALVVFLAGGVMLTPGAFAHVKDLTGMLFVRAEPPHRPDLTADIDLGAGNFLAWALLDRRTGRISGSANAHETSTTESMIKIWIVSDYLRRLGDQEPPADRLAQASAAIRDSDDQAAESLFRAGGGTNVTRRMIKMCGLTDTRISTRPGLEDWWSYTEMSPRDAVRMGECVKNGTAAGPRWTDWVLDEMTKVRGTTDESDQPYGGRWGIIDGLPEEILRPRAQLRSRTAGLRRTTTESGTSTAWRSPMTGFSR